MSIKSRGNLLRGVLFGLGSNLANRYYRRSNFSQDEEHNRPGEDLFKKVWKPNQTDKS